MLRIDKIFKKPLTKVVYDTGKYLDPDNLNEEMLRATKRFLDKVVA